MWWARGTSRHWVYPSFWTRILESDGGNASRSALSMRRSPGVSSAGVTLSECTLLSATTAGLYRVVGVPGTRTQGLRGSVEPRASWHSSNSRPRSPTFLIRAAGETAGKRVVNKTISELNLLFRFSLDFD
jgi:hypothetical protein